MDRERLISHDAKVAALTACYTTILGGEVATTWSFNIEPLYEGAPRADLVPLVAPFTEQEACTAVRAMSLDSTPRPNGIGPGFYAAA